MITSLCQAVEAGSQFLRHFTALYTLSLSGFLFKRFEEIVQHLGGPRI